MASRKRRVFFSILTTVLALLVLVVVVVPLLVPKDRLKALAEDRVRAMTGGTVTLGDVSVRVLPRVRLVLGESALVVTGAGLRGAGLAPGPLDSAVVHLDRFEIDLAVWPLLQRRLEFGEVRLLGPDVLVVTLPPAPADSASAAAGEASPPEPAAAWGMALAGFEVRDGRVVWREAGTPRRVAITGWRQDISSSDLGALTSRLQRLAGMPVAETDGGDGPASLGLETAIDRVELAGFGERPLPPFTDVRLEAGLSVGPAAERAEFRVDRLTTPGWRASAAGHASRERLEIAELNLASESGAIDVSGNCRATLPPASGPLAAALAGEIDLAGALAAVAPWLPPQEPGAPPLPQLTGTVRVSLRAGDGAAPPLNRPLLWQQALAGGLLDTLVVTAEGAALTAAVAQLGEPIRIGRLEYRGDLGAPGLPQVVQVRDLAHPALQGDARLDLRIGLPGAPHTVTLAAPNVDLDALTAIVQQQQAAAVPGGQASARWSLVDAAWAAPAARPVGEMIPPDLAIDYSATAPRVTLMKMAYTDVRVEGTLRERVIDVASLRASLGTGDVAGRATVDYATHPDGAVTFAVEAAGVPASALLAPYVPQIASLWDGRLRVASDGRFRIGEPAAMMKSLSIAGEIAASDGRIDLSSLLSSIQPYLGGRQDLLRVTYSQYAQSFRIDEGKVQVNDLRIDGPDTDWRGDGWLGLDGTIDMDIAVKLPAGFVPDLGELAWVADALKDEQGRLDLAFSITGQQTSPAVALDLDTQQLRDQLEGQVKEKVKEGLGGLLDKLKRR